MFFLNAVITALTKLSRLSDRLVPLFLSMAVFASIMLLAFSMLSR